MYKHFTHEGGVKAPLIAHWPAAFTGGGAWIRGLAHTVDLMPTLRDAAGADYPAQHNGAAIPPEEGLSLLPAMRGEALADRTLFFSHEQARGVIDGTWKAVFSKRTPKPPEWELYDLSADPCETHDLAKEHPHRLDAMAAEWEAYRIRVGLEPFEPWSVPEQEDIAD
jgi:arylsulfatase